MIKMRTAFFVAAVSSLGYLSVATAQQTPPAVPDQLKVSIDASQTADPVSKYIFGSFIEHIGTTIYRSMWAEIARRPKILFPHRLQRSSSAWQGRKAATPCACNSANGVPSAPMKWS